MGLLLIKQAAAVITGNKDNRVLYDTDILIDGPQIKKIGRNILETIQLGSCEIIDGRNMYIYPGLINTHHHFFQAFIRNNAWLDWTTLDVLEWIETIYPLFCAMTPEAIFHTTMISMADLVRHGCTTAFDHQYCYPKHAGLELVDQQMAAAEIMGMRFHAGRGANTLSREDGSPLPEELIEDTTTFLKDCDRLVSTYHDYGRFAMKRVAAAPCQPINCTEETFRETVLFAREKQIHMHTHLGEGEDIAMVERYGMRTLEWCRRKEFIGSDVWFAHGWDLQDDEIDLLSETGTGLSHCPAPVFLGGFTIPDIPRMYAMNVPLGLGCDGQSSNDNSNLLEALRNAYLLQCLAAGERNFPVPEPAEFLKIGTSGGAALLGRDDIGTLLPGKAADMFMINIDRLEYIGALHDPASLPVKVGISGNVDMTIINGEVVYRDGNFTRFDEKQMTESARESCMKIMYRNPKYAEKIIKRL